jgi:hypothetical protein
MSMHGKNHCFKTIPHNRIDYFATTNVAEMTLTEIPEHFHLMFDTASLQNHTQEKTPKLFFMTPVLTPFPSWSGKGRKHPTVYT